MGRIQKDLYNGIEWLYTSYDSIESLMGLIIFRQEYDREYTSGDVISGDDIFIYNENIRFIYIDLDNMIQKTNLSKKQRYIIDNLFSGLSLHEIANLFNADKKDILSILRSACKKIQIINHADTVDWLEHTGRVKVSSKNRYKRCSKCGRDLPEKYFSVDQTKQTGLRSWCKICRS